MRVLWQHCTGYLATTLDNMSLRLSSTSWCRRNVHCSFSDRCSGSCGELCWGSENPWSHGVSNPLKKYIYFFLNWILQLEYIPFITQDWTLHPTAPNLFYWNSLYKDDNGGRKDRQNKVTFGLQNQKCIFFWKFVICSQSTYLLTPRIELYINRFQINFIEIHGKMMARTIKRE